MAVLGHHTRLFSIYLKGMHLLRLLGNPGFIITKISCPLYTTQFKTFNITLSDKHNRLEKKIVQQKEVKCCLDCYVSIMYLAKPCVIIPGQFDVIHNVTTSDHIWKILIHNSSKKVIDQVDM